MVTTLTLCEGTMRQTFETPDDTQGTWNDSSDRWNPSRTGVHFMFDDIRRHSKVAMRLVSAADGVHGLASAGHQTGPDPPRPLVRRPDAKSFSRQAPAGSEA
ncbi:unnamed protein product [Ectocarpus sp. 13 AM-2016]